MHKKRGRGVSASEPGEKGGFKYLAGVTRSSVLVFSLGDRSVNCYETIDLQD